MSYLHPYGKALEAVQQDISAGRLRTSLVPRRHTALSPTIRSVYLENVLKYILRYR